MKARNSEKKRIRVSWQPIR